MVRRLLVTALDAAVVVATLGGLHGRVRVFPDVERAAP
jgi:hypothetical protein